jgi:hypothetical protein
VEQTNIEEDTYFVGCGGKIGEGTTISTQTTPAAILQSLSFLSHNWQTTSLPLLRDKHRLCQGGETHLVFHLYFTCTISLAVSFCTFSGKVFAISVSVLYWSKSFGGFWVWQFERISKAHRLDFLATPLDFNNIIVFIFISTVLVSVRIGRQGSYTELNIAAKTLKIQTNIHQTNQLQINLFVIILSYVALLRRYAQLHEV